MLRILVLLIMLLFSSKSIAAPSFVTDMEVLSTNSNNASYTVSFDSGSTGSNRYMTCYFATQQLVNLDTNITPQYAGVDMTQLEFADYYVSGAGGDDVYAYGLANPASGVNNLTWSYDGTGEKALGYCRVSQDVLQVGATAVGLQADNQTNDCTATADITTTTDNSLVEGFMLSFSFLNAGVDDWTPDTAGSSVDTERYEGENSGHGVTAVEGVVSTAGSATFTSNCGHTVGNWRRTVTLIELQEAVGNPPVFNPVTVSLSENSSNGTVITDINTVGGTSSDTDADGEAITYSETTDECGIASINSSTGVITVNDSSNVDFENHFVCDWTGEGTDGTNNATITATINLTNLDDTSTTFYLNVGYEDTICATDFLPSPIWECDNNWPNLEHPGAQTGGMFDYSTVQARSGNQSLAWNFDGRNGFINECQSGTYKIGSRTHGGTGATDNQSYFIDSAGGDLDALVTAGTSTILYNKTDRFCKHTGTVANENATNDRFNPSSTRNDMGGDCDFDLGDTVDIFAVCPAATARNDGDANIGYFEGETPATEWDYESTIIRQINYFKSSTGTFPTTGPKLGYASFNSGSNWISLDPSGNITFSYNGSLGSNYVNEFNCPDDTWCTIIEMFVRESNGGADGEWRVWYGSGLAYAPDYTAPDRVVDGITWGTYSNMSVPGNRQTVENADSILYLDDITVSDYWPITASGPAPQPSIDEILLKKPWRSLGDSPIYW